MWQSKFPPTPTLVRVPQEYPTFYPLQGIKIGVFPGYIPT